MRKRERKLNRKKDHDYSCYGSYFVTICTKNSGCIFGNILENEVQLNELGLLAEKFWKEIPDHFENVEIDQFVIMPDHIHGIIVLLPDGKYDDSVVNIGRDNRSAVPDQDKEIGDSVGTNHGLSLQIERMNQRLPNIIKQYKSSVTRESKQKNIWQRSYHDRIIRNNSELDKIRRYIFHNPLAWEEKITQNNPIYKSN